MNILNLTSSVIFALILLWCIFSPKVQDGLVMKIGMCLLVIVCFGDAIAAISPLMLDFEPDPKNKEFLFHLGGILTLIGRYGQVWLGQKRARRAGDKPKMRR